MALCFYISAMAVVVVALIALWAVADSAGIIDNVEKFIGDLFSADDFHFVSDQVLRGAVLVSIVLVALMVVFTIIAASFYNIFAELFGGDRDHHPRGGAPARSVNRAGFGTRWRSNAARPARGL